MIQIQDLNAGALTFLTRANCDGYVWVHLAGMQKGFRVQKVHISKLRADDGYNEILEATKTLPSMATNSSHNVQLELAVREAQEKKLQV
jgi:hypothetical protein